ncbi:hypothetical protein KUCAC02_019076, partial [Chaenocephalus aceratus]
GGGNLQPCQVVERWLHRGYEGWGVRLLHLQRRGPDPDGRPQPLPLLRPAQALRHRHGQVWLQAAVRGLLGGVSGLSKKQFLKINGFPNEYWGWGGEDDDIYNRITLNGMKVSRPDVRIGRYRMIKHERDKHNEPNPQRFNKIQNTKNTMKKDGISSLTYRVIQFKRYALYTNISVEIGKPPPRPIKG